MSNILISGAAGFIGSNLSKRLQDDGHHLVLIDDFSRGKQSYLDYLGVKTFCHTGDLRDYHIAKVITKNIDVVYHTACRIGGEQYLHGSPKIEFNAFYDNILIDNNILKSCIENNVKKIIFTSSASIHDTQKQYGDNLAFFKEEDLDFSNLPLNNIFPEGGYGWSKFLTENNLYYLSQMGIKTGIARLWKSYGPCDDYSPESGQVVLSLMRKAINYPKEPFIVWGNGQNKRNLLYVDDLIDGMVRISDYLDNHQSLTVNLGGDHPWSIGELAKKIVNISEKDIKIEYDTTKSGGPKSRIGILERAKKELNWQPTTSIDDGLKKTYLWLKEEL